MKAINSFSLGAVIAGAYIGAGFVSGQELWQFFGRFGVFALPAFLVAIVLISTLSYFVIHVAIVRKAYTFEGIINPFDSAKINAVLIAFEVIFYLSVYVIMLSGVESLFYDVFGTNKLLTGVLFALIVTLVALIGARGIISSFSLIIPLLVLVAIVISIRSLFEGKITFSVPEAQENPLISNPFISTLLFLSYNFYAGIGVFAVISKSVKKKVSSVMGAVIGGVMLFFLGGTIILSITTNAEFSHSDLPMLDVAKSLGDIFYYTYALLLILSMFSASLSSLFPISEKLKSTSLPKNTHAIIIVVISLLSAFLSLIGFKELIGIIYPLFGYAGFVIIALLIKNINKCK